MSQSHGKSPEEIRAELEEKAEQEQAKMRNDYINKINLANSRKTIGELIKSDPEYKAYIKANPEYEDFMKANPEFFKQTFYDLLKSKPEFKKYYINGQINIKALQADQQERFRQFYIDRPQKNRRLEPSLVDFSFAVEKKQYRTVAQMLQKKPYRLVQLDNRGRTPMAIAIENKDRGMVEILLASETNFHESAPSFHDTSEERKKSHQLNLMISSLSDLKKEEQQIVSSMNTNKNEINEENSIDLNFLRERIKSIKREIKEITKEMRLLPNYNPPYRVLTSNIAKIDKEYNSTHLIDQVCEKNGATPLFYAIKMLDFDMVQLLLFRGANINQPAAFDGHDLNTPLHYACAVHLAYYQDALKNAEFKAAIDRGEKNLATYKAMKSPEAQRYVAALKILELLIKKGANPNNTNYYGKKPIQLALPQGEKSFQFTLLPNNFLYSVIPEKPPERKHIRKPASSNLSSELSIHSPTSPSRINVVLNIVSPLSTVPADLTTHPHAVPEEENSAMGLGLPSQPSRPSASPKPAEKKSKAPVSRINTTYTPSHFHPSTKSKKNKTGRKPNYHPASPKG